MAFSDVTDPKSGVASMKEFDKIGRSAFLEKYGFGKARTYMVWDPGTGNLYDSKAIVGAAHGYQFPKQGPLKSTDFAGGEATVEQKLTSLGFEIVHIGEDWTPTEVNAVVSDYFEMLADESAGKTINKAHHNAALRKTLKSRTKASIELKHQNISAVLEELGLPFIDGYKPRHNYQAILKVAVIDFIEKPGHDISHRIIDPLEVPSHPKPILDWKSLLVEPPKSEPVKGKSLSGKRPRLPKKFDFAARDEQNRALGKAGESWVMDWEFKRLMAEGRPDLAKIIEWVSKIKGDGAGYDIRSYNTDESPRYIEVKTTNGGLSTAFLISRNEVAFSKEESRAFFLYRVFTFSRNTRLYILNGDLETLLFLEPQEYRARPR